MARNVQEKDPFTVTARLRHGTKSKSGKVTFVILKDGAEEKREEKPLEDGRKAQYVYDLPEVPKDKKKYVIEYFVVIDGDEYRNADEVHVWPRKVKVETKTEDGSKALPGLKFKPGPAAAGASSGVEAPLIKTTGDPAKAEIVLQLGTEFDPSQIEAVPPWEFVGAPEQVGGALRDLKFKAKLNLVGEILAPVIPGDKKIKQYVNLATATSGRDGKGDTVKFKVGIKDDAGRQPADRIGKAGVFLFILVEFAADGTLKKSERNDPKPRLRQSGDVSGWTEVTAGKKYKAKVELKGSDGTGEFEVVVGKAGGDTCTVKVGGTDACADAEVTLTNWRKIYYELMMPDFLGDTEDSPLDGGGTAKGIKAAGRDNMKASGDATFIEYAHVRTHRFTEGEAPAGTIMNREFFGRTTGNAKVFVLTDYSFTQYPTGHNFAKAHAGITCCVKACDVNLFYDGPLREAPVPAEETTETDTCEFALNNHHWLPISGYNGGDGVLSIRWTADTTGMVLPLRPTLTTADDTSNPATGKDAVVRLSVPALGLTHDVVFKNPKVGNVPTGLTNDNRRDLQSFVTRVCSQDNMKTVANALDITVIGPTDNDRRQSRVTNVKNALQGLVDNAFGYHPGLVNGQTARTDALALADIDMTASNSQKIVVKLPADTDDDPGSFAGAAGTAMKCPIKVRIEYEPHHSGLGLAGQDAQKGELLVVWGQNSPLCMTDTILHELGHQYAMTPYRMASGSHSPGLRRPKSITQDEDVAEYKHNGNKGHYYDEHKHSGNHCAYGLSDAQKGEASYQSGNKWQVAKCLMFGSNTSRDSQRCARTFCPQCVVYIRARDLSALA